MRYCPGGGKTAISLIHPNPVFQAVMPQKLRQPAQPFQPYHRAASLVRRKRRQPLRGVIAAVRIRQPLLQCALTDACPRLARHRLFQPLRDIRGECACARLRAYQRYRLIYADLGGNTPQMHHHRQPRIADLTLLVVEAGNIAHGKRHLTVNRPLFERFHRLRQQFDGETVADFGLYIIR